MTILRLDVAFPHLELWQFKKLVLDEDLKDYYLSTALQSLTKLYRMVDKLGLGTEVRELKLGSSFTNPKESAFHTLRYDFKPASVDINKMATIDVGTSSQITVTVPPNTVFKGSAKPYQKQCIVIVNTKTGEITLEKLTCNIQVKKTRSENRSKIPAVQKIPTLDQFAATQKAKKHGSIKGNNGQNNTPKSNTLKPGGKNKSKTQNLAANLGNMLPKHSPLHASPSRKSPNPISQPPSNSLPRIGLDDQFPDDWFCGSETNKYNANTNPDSKKKPGKGNMRNCGKSDMDVPPTVIVDRVKPMTLLGDCVGELSDSSTSSSSSSSGDSSDSSSDSEDAAPNKMIRQNGLTSPFLCVPDNLLKEDLQLSSESGTESD